MKRPSRSSILSPVHLSLLLLSSLTLTARVHAEVRWYHPSHDGVGTLRICYEPVASRPKPTSQDPDLIEVSFRYSGGSKLDRERSYPTIPDWTFRTIRLDDPTNPFATAFRSQVYACEIIWDYGMYWVLSATEVSGDR